jgi:hypothetical protein
MEVQLLQEAAAGMRVAAASAMHQQTSLFMLCCPQQNPPHTLHAIALASASSVAQVCHVPLYCTYSRCSRFSNSTQLSMIWPWLP